MQIKYAIVRELTRASLCSTSRDLHSNRVRTLTGKEIELDIEPDYKVRHIPCALLSSGNAPTIIRLLAHNLMKQEHGTAHTD